MLYWSDIFDKRNDLAKGNAVDLTCLDFRRTFNVVPVWKSCIWESCTSNEQNKDIQGLQSEDKRSMCGVIEM